MLEAQDSLKVLNMMHSSFSSFGLMVLQEGKTPSNMKELLCLLHNFTHKIRKVVSSGNIFYTQVQHGGYHLLSSAQHLDP
jgi:hypothetical protein